MSSKRFRIAFSFAGEKRDFVEKVAALLAERFGEGKILYDKYHQAEFSRGDLAFQLPDLYEKESDLIIAVLCPDYEKKEWCGLEWNAIFGLLKKGLVDLVMLTRFDQVEAKGLHGLAGYTDLDRLPPEIATTLILQRLALNEGLPKDRYTRGVAGDPGTSLPEPNARHLLSNNLPVLPHFFGRVEELKKIAAALLPAARTWGALIDGPGGIGKTSLAIRAAELVPPEDFQRILFLSAKEREMTADGAKRLDGYILPGYLAMLNEIATQLKQPELAKSTEDERPRLILDTLRGTRALLILDNLESLAPEHREQLFTFLSHLPPDCKAIVTSRRRTDIDARILRLEKLDHDAALAYLDDLAADRPHLQKATPEQRESLYTETGGNPLVIRWIAGQLGRGKCRSVPAALEFLRSAPADNDPLEFIFGDLLDTFTPDETAVLCALSYFTSLIDVKHIAEIAGLSATAAATALEDLTDRSLVIADADGEKYILTPLVGDYLRKARPEVIAETGSRLEKRAYALITENGYNNHERFPVLDGGWPTVAAAIPLFLSGANTRLQTVCRALFNFLNFTGRWDALLSLSQQAETKAAAAADHDKAGWRAYYAGITHYQRGEAGSVLACADRAEAHWTAAKAGARERSVAVRLRGMGHQLKKDYPSAIAAYLESLALDRSLSAESPDVAIGLNDLAEAELLSGDFPAAERHFNEALGMARVVDDSEGVATYTGNLADLAFDREDWPKAEALAREALRLAEDLGRMELIASNSCLLAEALVRQGNPAEGLPYARRSVDLYTHLRSRDLEAAHATFAECRLAVALERLNHGWTYNTTSLEGNTLTLGETREALDNPDAVIPGKPVEDSVEIRAQGAALRELASLVNEERDLRAEDLFRLHTQLMQGSTVDSLKPIGAWKIEDNGTPIKLDSKTVWNDNYAAARHVAPLMETWLTELNRLRPGKDDPFEAYLWLHVTFARIHPFADGNGRMARMLANIPLLTAGLPPVDIPATERDRYVTALARWQMTCGAPLPGDPLYVRPDLLDDFQELCEASWPKIPD